MKYNIPKGVFDILPQEPSPEDVWRTSEKWQFLEEVIRKTAHDYGYKEIRTPIFERTELFVRGVGESSDIVTKEMYTFEDKGGRSMTLRPEGTASVMRSFIEKGLYTLASLHKFFYIGPMFRYERPQAGRFRQHHQFGAEAIGNPHPEQDVEMIDMLCELYRRIGIKDITIQLNSVGDESSREDYRKALVEFLTPHYDFLSDDSKVRFSKNILRILDSKDPQDQKLLESAPSILDVLSPEAKDHFLRVQHLLKMLKLPFQLNPKLVRGLDYYTKTVFEITSGELGAQNSVGGGGRFDGLISSLGGPNLPAVGFATGIERILQIMMGQKVAFPPPPHPFVFLIGLGEEAQTFCFHLLSNLRHAKIPADMDLQKRKVSQAMQFADQLQANYAIIIGSEELQTQKVKIKNMKTREETLIGVNEIISKIQELVEKNFSG